MPPRKVPTFFRRRITELLGLSGVALGTFFLVAFTSYDLADPSFNHAVDAPVNNAAGTAGAYIAVPIMEFIGLGVIALIAVPLVWGTRLILKMGVQRLWLKTFLLLISLPALAGMFAVLDHWLEASEGWPSESYGGYIGKFLSSKISPLITPWGYGIAITAVALSCFLYALSLNTSQWQRFFSALWAVIATAGRGIYNFSGWTRRALTFLNDARTRFTEIVEGSEYDIEEAAARKPARVKKVKEPVEPRKVITTKKREIKSKPMQESFDIEMRHNYQIPPLSLLKPPVRKAKTTLSESSLTQNAVMLEKVLEDYGVQGKIVEVQPGPVVTLYALEPAAGVKSSRVIGLADDIARSMSAQSCRIAVIPGKNAIGIELPNSTRETVFLKELLQSDEFKNTEFSLPLALGKDISGEPQLIDLAKTPHMIVAGTTGSGKSVAVNAMILSLLYKYSPAECKFIMVDPKMLELSVYQDIPHLLTPVVTEPPKAVVALKWVVKEMENRYRLMSNLGVRNIKGYNEKLAEAGKKGTQLTRTVQTGFDPDSGTPIMETVPLEMSPLPFIVVIVDEMADLMIVAGKDIETSVQRLAQMARAAGIHVILATQRPSVDVITGVIKANFPTRISFQVSSKIDSRTIIGEAGAEQLLGMGDMLYMAGGGRLTRMHGPFVDDTEVENVVKFVKEQGQPHYVEEVTIDTEGDGPAASGELDPLFDQAVAIVVRDGKASTSYIQRQLKIGYNKAANLIEQMEREGVVGPASATGKREVLAR